MTISDWGGCITGIKVPNKDGEVQDVAVCPDDLQGLQNNSPFLGAMIGRTAGRTGNAQFELEGKTYNITANNGKHNLHGGNVGLHNARWTATEGQDDDSVFISLAYTSPDGEDGYPGNLSTTCKYKNDVIAFFFLTFLPVFVLNLHFLFAKLDTGCRRRVISSV